MAGTHSGSSTALSLAESQKRDGNSTISAPVVPETSLLDIFEIVGDALTFRLQVLRPGISMQKSSFARINVFRTARLTPVAKNQYAPEVKQSVTRAPSDLAGAKQRQRLGKIGRYGGAWTW